jgi:hypothetical protein
MHAPAAAAAAPNHPRLYSPLPLVHMLRFLTLLLFMLLLLLPPLLSTTCCTAPCRWCTFCASDFAHAAAAAPLHHRRVYSPLPLVHMLRHLVTRHTKDQQLDGQAVLTLPAKTVQDVPGEARGTVIAYF